MRLAILFLAVFSISADDSVGTMQSIPAQRHEEISRRMLAYQETLLNLAAAKEEVIRMEQAAQKAAQAWGRFLGKLQQEYGAPVGCSLTMDTKEWRCPEGVKKAGDVQIH